MHGDDFETKLASLTTRIRYCMDDMGRYSDATSREGRRKYHKASQKMNALQDELDALLENQYEEELRATSEDHCVNFDYMHEEE